MSFDIDADGLPEATAWTAPEGRDDAFLGLDRNGNGRLDHGGELFGNATKLGNGLTALHGYIALAELDTIVFGGNGDGWMDPSDPAYWSLLLWRDENHDGVSQEGELRSLPSEGILRMDLRYRMSDLTDPFGNRLRFWSRGWKTESGELAQVISTDVFFLTE